MRRLPVYLLIDTSGSMIGEPIQAVNVGLQTMMASLRQDPHALESVHLSIITFDKEVNLIFELTELSSVQIPEIKTPESGPTFLGEALKLLNTRIDEEIKLSTADAKGDWMPLLFVMTDGKPSDIQIFEEHYPKLKTKNFGSIIGCAAGPKAKESYLELFCDKVVSLDTTDANAFQQFFKWVSASVSVGNRSVGAADDVVLPPPPPEVNLVI
ncbi:MAG: VWA domain-containing protein [Flavobacteriales bacterium]|nr:VWA domain-containing protein [Flavobacteriales bacterium]